jgi:Uncharacterized protein conserved in bacteria (DUF2147)
MKKLTILAALLMTTTCAYAGNNSISFEIDGHKVKIEAPKNCDQLSCIKISGFDFNGFGSKRFDDDDDAAVKADAPVQKPAPTPQATAPLPQPQTPATPAVGTAPAPAAVAATSTQPVVKDNGALPPTAPATATPANPAPVAAPVQAAATPIGVWSTEDDKGRVRIESCGQNLCGYAVKTGEKILINMKPSDAKWVGRIHDPDSGRDYDSTIAMKGTNSLRVQGCAFGGLFCGGQIWNRVS